MIAKRNVTLWMVAAFAFAAVAFASAASATFNPGYYTHTQCPPSSATRKDPVNVVFYDWGT